MVSYWGDLRDRAHLSPMVTSIASLEAVVCDSAHEAAWLERNLLQACLPPWNSSPSGGQEVEVWIRLSESARAPGIRVVHQPSPGARHFGPYLGGRKVRLAVSGMCRVLPLAYTTGELAGTRHEMALTLGVSAAERAAMARTAASTLAFEFAARLQEELQAVTWITAEQKVTRPAPEDFDVCGWADGTLIRLQVRGGRLIDWTQRACPAGSARRHVGGTPPEWAGFAQRNAELAARLA